MLLGISCLIPGITITSEFFKAVGGANIQIVHYLDHVFLEEEKSMIHSVPPYEKYSSSV
jgi:hypothetical protein